MLLNTKECSTILNDGDCSAVNEVNETSSPETMCFAFPGQHLLLGFLLLKTLPPHLLMEQHSKGGVCGTREGAGWGGVYGSRFYK